MELFERKLDEILLSNMPLQDRKRHGTTSRILQNNNEADGFDTNTLNNDGDDNEERGLRQNDDEVDAEFNTPSPTGEIHVVPREILSSENNIDGQDENLNSSIYPKQRLGTREITTSSRFGKDSQDFYFMFDKRGMDKGNFVKRLQTLHQFCLPKRMSERKVM